MDDKVSRWLFSDWFQNTDHVSDQVLKSTLGRMINWPDTLNEIKVLFPNLELIREKLHSRANSGNKIFTGAYIVPPIPGIPNKIDSVMKIVGDISESLNWINSNSTSMKRCWESLTKFSGIGSFLSGQIVADLSHCKYGMNWKDKETWAPLGPGSTRGMNRLRGFSKSAKIKQGEFEYLLPLLMNQLRKDPLVNEIWINRELWAMDIQNCLCEFDKYRRLTLGEGTVRARYNGRK